MILDDLLIYGDWLEENDIKNNLYKQFLNLLRIKLRINNQYIPYQGTGDGNGYGCGNGNGSYTDRDSPDNRDYGCGTFNGFWIGNHKGNGWGVSGFGKRGDGFNYDMVGICYGDGCGDGYSI